MGSAETYFEQGDFVKAAECYHEASRRSDQSEPAYFDAILGLALSLDHLGRFREAEVLYNDVISARRSTAEQKSAASRNLVYAGGVRHFAAAEFAAARSCFAKALTLQPGDDEFRGDILRWLSACELGEAAAACEANAEFLAKAAGRFGDASSRRRLSRPSPTPASCGSL